MKPRTKVEKALAPEEATILENIASLVQELLAGGGEEAPMEEEVVEMEEDMPMEDEVEKSTDGATASDKAEDRLEEPSYITEKNLSEVGKALRIIANSVQKSAPKRVAKSENQMVMNALLEMSKVLKGLGDQQKQNNMAIGNILDGLGVVDTVTKSKEVQRQRPVQNLDSTAVLNELVSVLKSAQNAPERNAFSVKKSAHTELRDALPLIFGGK